MSYIPTIIGILLIVVAILLTILLLLRLCDTWSESKYIRQLMDDGFSFYADGILIPDPYAVDRKKYSIEILSDVGEVHMTHVNFPPRSFLECREILSLR